MSRKGASQFQRAIKAGILLGPGSRGRYSGSYSKDTPDLKPNFESHPFPNVISPGEPSIASIACIADCPSHDQACLLARTYAVSSAKVLTSLTSSCVNAV